MDLSIKKTEEAHTIIKKYSGNNPYLRILKNEYNTNNKLLNDFKCDFILNNYNYEPQKINKIVKIADWLGENLKERLGAKFIPEKVQITYLLGETSNTYLVYLNYKQNQEKPSMVFLAKRGVLDDFKIDDFNNYKVDFTKYNEKLEISGKKLYEHQETAVKFLLSRKKCVLADSMGLGKSLSAIVASIEGEFKKILVICPASVKSTWKREIKTFIPEDEIAIINSTNWINNKKYTIINYDILDLHYKIPYSITMDKKYLYNEDGSPELDENGKQKAEIIEVKSKYKSRKKEEINKALSESNLYLSNFDLVIIDECHKLSVNTSIRYQVIDDFIKKTKINNIFLLSGTPMTNKPINLYYVFSLINHPVCDNQEYFIKRYCDGKQIKLKKTNKKIWLRDGASNLDELMEKVKSSYLRRVKDDIPGMVQKIIHQRYYELTDDERSVYEKLWDDYEQSQLELGNDNLNKELTEGIFLRQFVANAMVKNTIELTNEFIDDGNKVFIACCFNEEVSALKEYFGEKSVIYKGGMTTKQKDSAEYKFMNDPKTTVFIGNIIAAGVGLTLTASHICIFNSYSWVPGDNAQTFDRVHRIGQKEDVQVYFQLFSDTISERMWDTIIRKELNINKVIKEEKTK